MIRVPSVSSRKLIQKLTAMKQLLMVILLLSSLPLMAQLERFEATIVDAKTHEPLPFASIYASQKSSTISNAVGVFSIKCSPDAVLRISYVGYKTIHVQASELGGRVALEPLANQLKEVIVTPIDLKDFIRKTTSETRRQLRKNEKRKSSFFYRQTTFADSTCFELMEAFLQAKSAVFLRDLVLLKGRFAGIQPDSLHRYSFWTNFFIVSELPMLTRYDYHDNIGVKPLVRNYRDYYDVGYDIMGDGDDRILAIQFTPKPRLWQSVLAVTLYVNARTHLLQRMEGEVRNVNVVHKEYVVEEVDTGKVVRQIKTNQSSTFHLTVNMTEERGFLEVQSVYVDQQFMRYGKCINTRSIMFNVDGMEGTDGGRKMWNYGDLHNYVREQGYDQQFWHDNEMVRRTPVEQQVMEMFESQNLFGVFE